MMRLTARPGALLVIVALGGAALGGCAASISSPSENWLAGKRFVKLGTAPVGGAFFVVGGALAEVINKEKPEQLGKFTAVATKGSQQNIRNLDSGELDFAICNSAVTYFAVRGQGRWEKEYDIRSLMTLAPNVGTFITREGSGIRSLADLKGKRVIVGPSGAGFDYFLAPVLEAHGVTYDDFKRQYGTASRAVDLLGDGAVDAAFLGGAVPTPAIIQACSTLDCFFIPFDPEARQRLIEDFSFLKPAVIPPGVYSDLKERFDALNVGSMHLVTRGDQDEELVYQVTKTIYENRADVVKKHAAGRAINPQVVVQEVGTEFHPGAVRYYREIGIWPEASPELKQP